MNDELHTEGFWHEIFWYFFSHKCSGEANFLGGVASVKGVKGFDPEAAKKRFFEIYLEKVVVDIWCNEKFCSHGATIWLFLTAKFLVLLVCKTKFWNRIPRCPWTH